MIFIPTYGRIEKQKTLSWFGQDDRERTILVVRPEEEKQATKLYKDLLGVVVCSKPGVAAARQAAVNYTMRFTREKVIAMFDDDLQFCQRVKDWDFYTNNRALRPTQEDVDKAVQWLFDKCGEIYPISCIAPRGGNNTIEERWEIFNGRIMRSFAVHIPTLIKHKVRFDEFYYWEDFHVALSLLELGYQNIINVDAVTGGDTNSKGGVQRNLPKMWECIRAFQKMHPTIRIREKEMNDGDRGPKAGRVTVPDMTVYWKKALGSKSRNRAMKVEKRRSK